MPDTNELTLDTIAERAQRHQDELDRDVKFLSVADLATRWRCSKATVRAIPIGELPWKNLGRGTQREMRRYHVADVEVYENAGVGTPGNRRKAS